MALLTGRTRTQATKVFFDFSYNYKSNPITKKWFSVDKNESTGAELKEKDENRLCYKSTAAK
jgi:hypothetical protein